MKLYKTTHQDVSDGECIEWASSKRAATAQRAVLKREAKDPSSGIDFSTIVTEAVDFPTRRNDVVAWLNQHLARDNG